MSMASLAPCGSSALGGGDDLRGGAPAAGAKRGPPASPFVDLPRAFSAPMMVGSRGPGAGCGRSGPR
jgi:hypothetical protein